ncbi:unnamed protein product [Ectocarpus sp. CCAP 1310/34]|nr:unnamed protein product [Ectocarpus sp. CCAP 1310/34]
MEAAASGAETSAASASALHDGSFDGVSIDDVAGFAGDLGASLQEVLSTETSSGTHDVGAEEEETLLDVGGEDRIWRNTTPSGNSARNDLQLANVDANVSPPAGAAPAVCASLQEVLSTETSSGTHDVGAEEEETLLDVGGEDRIWRNTTPSGNSARNDLQLANVDANVSPPAGAAPAVCASLQVYEHKIEGTTARRSSVSVRGNRESAKTADVHARKKTSTKKDVCLWHTYQGSGGTGHDPPRVIENEMTREDLEAESANIKKMHEKGVKTAEIYKYLQETGKRLGDKGKQMVS